MLRLVPIETRLARLAEHPAELESVLGARLGTVAPVVADVLAQTLAHQGADRAAEWGGFLVLDADAGQVVGACAFVNAPDERGEVEIAYFTFPPFEGRGVASAMAAELVRRAESSERVRRICAHTLPEMNASAKVLARLGFARSGTSIDADAGEVWRWEKPVARAV